MSEFGDMDQRDMISDILNRVINIESLTMKILDEIHEMKSAAKVTVTKTGFTTKGKKRG